MTTPRRSARLQGLEQQSTGTFSSALFNGGMEVTMDTAEPPHQGSPEAPHRRLLKSPPNAPRNGIRAPRQHAAGADLVNEDPSNATPRRRFVPIGDRLDQMERSVVARLIGIEGEVAQMKEQSKVQGMLLQHLDNVWVWQHVVLICVMPAALYGVWSWFGGK